MKILAHISRITVGLVFIFSGFVKGVDPLGTAYRIEDYFIAYGTEWAIPLALFLSIFLCTLEFSIGVSLLLNFRLKVVSWFLLILMVYFTVLTYFDAVYNPVPDCGCFGDALKITNWQTFIKNIVLIILVIIIFIYRKKFRSVFLPHIDNIGIVIIFAGFFLFSFYQYRHLPLIDFRDWKIGTDLVPDDPGIAKTYLTYRNINTGEEKEYLSPNYPWNDSIWMLEWKFVEQRIDDSGVKKGHSLKIFTGEGIDYTESFVNNPGYQFLVAAYDLDESCRKGFLKVNELYEDAYNDGHSVIVLTSSMQEKIDEYRKDLNPDLEFYFADDIELKTMVRANPGIILLKDGVVMAKWHWRDLPEYAEIKEDFKGL